MSTVRLRRLRADYEKLSEYLRQHPRLRLIQTEGDPPEKYQIEYQIKSLRTAGGELQPVQRHIVEISLPLNYPRTPPQCRMLSPVFHPNIAPHAICVGDHWGAGESLQSIVTRIGEMLAFQSYNVKSPLNGEAARWVEENKHRLPLDGVSLLVEENGETPDAKQAAMAPGDGVQVQLAAAQAASAVQPTTPAGEVSESAPISIVCPACGATYRMPGEFANRKVRCRKCMHVFVTAAT
jgi:ubiquitin-protein ligase